MYDDTEIRGEISNVKTATAKNATDISKNTADISANAANIAKNAADIKTAGDKIETLASSLSALSSSVTDNTTAINTAEENIEALSSSVTAAGELIAKNASDISASNAKITGLESSKQDKLTGTAGQVVGFDGNGNAVAQTGGVDGVTFTPAVSDEGIISWTNDGGRENPASVNIKGQPGDPGNNGVTPHIGDNGHWYIGETDTGVAAQGDPGPAGTYTAGYGISISSNTIAFSSTAGTRQLATGSALSLKGVTASNVKYFTISSQSSNLSSIQEYLRSGSSSVSFKTFYGYLTLDLTANQGLIFSPVNAIAVKLSHSADFAGAAGFAVINISGSTKCIAMAHVSAYYVYLCPTESINISSGDSVSITIYLH